MGSRRVRRKVELVKRILLTGMSGTGKSTVIVALAALGYPALDMDEPSCSEYAPDGDWIWREDRIHAFLSQHDGAARFVSGCATNQIKFYPRGVAVSLPIHLLDRGWNVRQVARLELGRQRTEIAIHRAGAVRTAILTRHLPALVPDVHAIVDGDFVTYGDRVQCEQLVGDVYCIQSATVINYFTQAPSRAQPCRPWTA